MKRKHVKDTLSSDVTNFMPITSNSYTNYPFPKYSDPTRYVGSLSFSRFPFNRSGAITSETSDIHASDGVGDSLSDSSDENPHWTKLHSMILYSAVTIYAEAADTKPGTAMIDIEKLEWEKISKHFPHHNSLDCYRHWNVLCPNIPLEKTSEGVCLARQEGPETFVSHNKRRRGREGKKPWTNDEVNSFDKLHQRFGNKWTKIVTQMKTGRTSAEAKNFWHSNKDKMTIARFKEKQEKSLQ